MRRVKKHLLAVAAVGCLLAWPAGSHDQTVTTAGQAMPTDVTWGP